MVRGSKVNILRHGRSALCICLIVLGCGHKDSAEFEISEEEAALEFSRIACDGIASCGCAFEGEDAWNSCEGDLADAFVQWQENALQNGAKVDLECLNRHLKMRAAEPCIPKERCLIYYGTKEKGESCLNYDRAGYFSDCQQGYECPTFLGYCVENAPVDLEDTLDVGMQCIDEHGDHVGVCSFMDDLYCNLGAPVPNCEPRGAPGDRCEIDLGCGSGSHCDGLTCVFDKAIGEACSRREECASFECHGGACSDELATPAICDFLLP